MRLGGTRAVIGRRAVAASGVVGVDCWLSECLASKSGVVSVLRVVGVALICLLVGMALASGLVDKPGAARTAGARRVIGEGASGGSLRREQDVREAQRLRWLASPAARARRVASRMEFDDLGVGAARGLLMRDYGPVLAGASANPAASIVREGPVVRYLGNHRVVVRTPHGLQLKVSTAPLRVAGRGGVMRPVDLGLVARGEDFVPVRPLAAVAVARDSGGGVAFGVSGLRIALEGANVSGSASGGQSVFFGDVGRDMDSVVTPALDGAELFAVLRSRLSPQELRYRVALPAGAVLRAVAGGAVISRSGVMLARVAAPSARDAQGVVVPVGMVVAGDEFVLSVEHRSLDVAYPLLVDPKVITITTSGEGWKFIQAGAGNITGAAGGGVSLVAEEATYPVGGSEDSEAKWQWKPPSNPEFIAAEFSGLSFSASSFNKKGEPKEGVHWEVDACGQGAGGSVNYSPPPSSQTFYGERGAGHNCENHIISVYLGQGGSGLTDKGSFSVSAIVLTARWHALGDHLSEEYGPIDESGPFKTRCMLGEPVNCSTGNQTVSQTDLQVGGRGPGLILRRTYNSQLAATQTEPGAFGYGWTGPYSAHIVFGTTCEGCITKTATVYANNGGTTYFEYIGSQWVPAAALIQAQLTDEGTGYVYTFPDQTKLSFESAGRLISETDRDGDTVTMNRNSEGRLESVSDAAGRKLAFTYDGSGQVESAEDPLGHIVKYAYEGGNLVSVTQPGEASLRWQFKYNSSHEMTEMTDGRGNTVTTEYNSSHQVVAQTDALKRKRTWQYGMVTEGTYTEITEPNGAVTREEFNLEGLPTSVTHAYGTVLAATTTYEYDGYYNLIAVTNPDKHTTKYGYDVAGDRTSETDADGDETQWAYDSTHDVTSVTTPQGETTTIKREAHGNPEVIERPAPGEKTQATRYKYDAYGDLESVSNPLEHTTKYEYDAYGDLVAEVDPEGNKRTWAYNEDSQEVSTTSPRGNAAVGEASRFTTAIERDAEGRVLALVEPLSEALYGSQFGSAGSGAGQFSVPIGMAVDSSGDIWVADSSNNRLEKFTAGGSFVEAIGFGVSDGREKYEVCTSGCQAGIAGKGEGQFEVPKDVAINASTGDIYVADSGNGRVDEFSSSAAFIRAFGTSGGGRLSGPDGLAVGSGGSIWVADSGNNRVVEFSESGAYEAAFGTEGAGEVQFKEPKSIAVAGGDLYVDDFGNNRIEELTSKGVYVRQFGTAAGIGQLKEPARICVDPLNGDLVVADHGNNRIAVYNQEGAFLTKFGSVGKGEGQFENLKGVLVSPAGVVYTTDAGNDRAEQWAAPAARVTKYTYDAAGNLETATDPNGNKTKYTYDADNELTKVEEPNKTLTETEYDSAGQVTGQTDGNKHTTKYVRNLLEEVTEVVDPLGHKTTREYDAAGNLTGVTNPAKQTTTYTYDPASRLVEVKYSDGKTPTVKYEYNKDGDRTMMSDGTGTSKYTYDQLDRLIETENGHKEKTRYEYDLAGEQTKITYPNEKSITRAYDKDSRLEKITDWLANVTKFTYDPDSELASTVFPGASTDEDKYAYNEADAISEVKMLKGSETLASLLYTRDSDEQIKTTTSKGLPGEEKTANEYDTNDRLTKAATNAYEYDAANNPTKIAGAGYKYNAADELETGPSLTYTYTENNERTKTTPSAGPATTYGYDQAANLTTVERPKEGETPKIENTYTYNGENLRASQTISGTTSYLTWDTTEELPLLLNDTTNSYIYGPDGLPIEQINNTTDTVLYLHHDQQGSTRLLTGSTGKVEGKCSYSAYGVPTCEGSATMPLGFDAQYTSADTGLIYLRNRVYDPSTAQFLSVDPLVKLTGAPYNYAGDNPVNEGDPTGLLGWSEIGQAVGVGLVCVATDGAGCVAAGLADLDANVISNDYEAVAESCRAGEEESSSLTDLAGFALGAGVGGVADGSLSEEAKKALESTSAGQAALKQLVGLGVGSSALTTLAYAQGHESSGSSCSCGG
jgi:RHS repeat-associated protein